MKQLRFSRPQRIAQVRRLTERQEALVRYLRWEGKPIQVDRLAGPFGYAHPRAACDRLVARGLAVRIEPGIYQARKLRERRA